MTPSGYVERGLICLNLLRKYKENENRSIDILRSNLIEALSNVNSHIDPCSRSVMRGLSRIKTLRGLQYVYKLMSYFTHC